MERAGVRASQRASGTFAARVVFDSRSRQTWWENFPEKALVENENKNFDGAIFLYFR